jgi:2-polyprenyl-3-methyl-5-hydroxy-6-metoxy-1,4-benzoquinol methylase
MDYRNKLYEKYSSFIQDQNRPADLTVFDAWGNAYQTYFRNWLPRDKEAAILDVACGYGRLLRFFLKQGYTNLTGIDISPEQVENAKKIHPNVILGNALEYLQKNPGKFDLITGLDIIEHLYKDEAIRFLELAHLALKSNGRLIIQTPNADTPFGLIHRYNDLTHEICFNVNSLSKLMKICGFKNIEQREQGPVSHGVLSFFRYILWQCIRILLIVYNVIETGNSGSRILTRVFLVSGTRA